jgi:hypothetical protein
MKQATRLIMMFVVWLLPVISVASWGVPPSINYQGRLTSPSGEPLDTIVSMSFSLYRDSIGGIPMSTVVHDSVVVTNGLFQANFCDTICIDSCSPWESCFNKYLGITVGSDPEIEPRTRISSVPFAFHAAWIDGFKSSPKNVNSGLYTVVGGDSNTVMNDYSSIAGGRENLINIINEGDTILDTTDATFRGTSFYYTPGDRQNPWGAFIGGGKKNQVLANFALVTGGWHNTAYCPFSAIVGGILNEAGDRLAFIGGGRGNIIGGSDCLCGKASVISGGFLNSINGLYSTVGGGLNNQILNCSRFVTIDGGHGNVASGDHSTIGGGNNNTSLGEASTVGGGQTCHADFDFSTVAGGRCISIQSNYGSVGGGYENYVNGEYGTVGGGHGNYASGIQSTVGGGFSNFANGDSSFVGGGANNIADGRWSTIGGGISHTATSQSATVGGGYSNDATGGTSTIGGGEENTASGQVSTVGGGWHNTASGDTSVVCGGWENQASGVTSMVLGGSMNIAQGASSFASGRKAEALHDGSFVWADLSEYSSFASTGNNQFLIRAVGGVGIRTNTPQAIFHVGGNNDDIGVFPAYIAPTSTNGVTPAADPNRQGLLINTFTRNIDGYRRYADIVSLGYANGTYGGGVIRFLTNDEVTGSGEAVERMRIDRNGNVGIGTNTPARKLHIDDVMRLEPRDSAPSPASEGDIYVNSTDHHIYCYLNGSWKQLDN